MDCRDNMQGNYCGCDVQDKGDLTCCMPGVIETKLLNMPQKCVKPPCNYSIPAIPCNEIVSPRPDPPNPLCFDWTVQEPGPNDSYGLNGLNWYDFNSLKRHYDIAPESEKPRPWINPAFQCQLPIECYSRHPPSCCRPGFALDVNYFRDWRCCRAVAATGPWRPPHKREAATALGNLGFPGGHPRMM